MKCGRQLQRAAAEGLARRAGRLMCLQSARVCDSQCECVSVCAISIEFARSTSRGPFCFIVGTSPKGVSGSHFRAARTRTGPTSSIEKSRRPACARKSPRALDLIDGSRRTPLEPLAVSHAKKRPKSPPRAARRPPPDFRLPQHPTGRRARPLLGRRHSPAGDALRPLGGAQH